MKEKSRPTNNFHCFVGNGRHLSREAARGMGLFAEQLRSVVPGEDNSVKVVDGFRQESRLEGYVTSYQSDPDGAALQSGGIYSPQEYKLTEAYYRRFISTKVHTKYGASAALYGSWWLEEDHYDKLVHYARRNNSRLDEVAAQALYIPPEWGDCGYAIQAKLTTPLKSWAGRGKIASGSLSPNSAMRTNEEVAYGIPGLSEHIRQLYVPFPFVVGETGKGLNSFFELHRVANTKNEF